MTDNDRFPVKRVKLPGDLPQTGSFCRACNGQGHIFIAKQDVRWGQFALDGENVERQTCEKCGGTGRVPKPQEAKQ